MEPTTTVLEAPKLLLTPAVLWASETETALAFHLNTELFSSKKKHVVFLCKTTKPLKGAASNDEVANELLVVCRSTSDEFTIHNIVAGEQRWIIKSTESLRNLRSINSEPSIPFSLPFQNTTLCVKLEFQSFSKTTLCRIMLTRGDKNLMIYCLFELCRKFCGVEIGLENVNTVELHMLKTSKVIYSRCPLLESTADTEEVSQDIIIKQFTNQPETNSEVEENILSDAEQELLLDVLQAENLTHIAPGELMGALHRRVLELESETGDVLRTWENRGDNSDFVGTSTIAGVASDPIASLVENLDCVFHEMSELQAWMANYDKELRTMRQDIEKIAVENERLHMSSKNDQLLKSHIKKLLSRYAISQKSIDVWSNVGSILHDQVLQEIEFGKPPKGDLPALALLTNTANELQLGLQGKAGKDSTSSLPEEPYMLAVTERVNELADMIEVFCGHVYMFLSNRIKASADEFRETIATVPASSLDKLPIIISRVGMHKKLTPYAALINSLQQLEQDGFEKVIQVYSQDMGEAYEDVLANFFSVMNNRVSLELRTVPCQMSEIHDAELGNGIAEINQSKARAEAAFHQKSTISPAAGLRHTLEQLMPMIVDEQTFLSKVFWNMDAYENTESCNFLTKRTNRKKAMEELQWLVDSIFTDKGKILSCTVQLCVYPVSKANAISELIFMMAQAESCKLAFGNRSSFINDIICNPKIGLLVHLEESFDYFIQGQIKAFENHDIRAPCVFGPVKKLPGFFDRITALWDVCASKVLFDSTDAKFRDHFVGKKLALVLKQMTAWVEHASGNKWASKPMMHAAVRLENFYFLYHALEQRNNAVLVFELAKTKEAFENSLNHFVESNLGDTMPQLTMFVHAIEDLVKQIDAADVVYHYSRLDLAKVLQQVNTSYIEAAIVEVKNRTKKSIWDSAELRQVIFKKVHHTVVSLVQSYIDLVQECYGDAVIGVSVEEIKSVLKLLVDSN